MSLHTETARAQMLSQQVRAWAVLDPAVLAALGEVPRERFMPPGFQSMAFADTAIPLPGGQRMLTPQLQGRILQALALGPGDRVLEIGTGCGYLTACMGKLARHVTSLEIDPELADTARRNLRETDAANCEVLTQDAFAWQPPQTYDAIAVTGALPVFDDRFQQWLAPGGRLWMAVGQAPAQDVCLIKRNHGGFARESLFETVLPALQNAPQPESFRF